MSGFTFGGVTFDWSQGNYAGSVDDFFENHLGPRLESLETSLDDAISNYPDLYFSNYASSLSVAVGPLSITIAAKKSFKPNMWVLIHKTVDATQYMYGQVTAYSSVTGNLTVAVTETGGSGSHSGWSVVFVGKPGTKGDPGSDGSDGGQGPAGQDGADGVTPWSEAGGNVAPLNTAANVAIGTAAGNAERTLHVAAASIPYVRLKRESTGEWVDHFLNGVAAYLATSGAGVQAAFKHSGEIVLGNNAQRYLVVDKDGSVLLHCPNSASGSVVTPLLPNSSLAFEVDETTNQLKIVIKKSDATTKETTLNLS